MSFPPVTGHLSAHERGADHFNPVSDQEALFGAGRALMDGVTRLQECSEPPIIALAFLAGQAAECLLKALLVARGVPEKTLRAPDVRHNLDNLWGEASRRVSSLCSQSPHWLQQLSGVHAAPYVLRYPLGLHGMVLPARLEMVDGLERLLAVTKKEMASAE